MTYPLVAISCSAAARSGLGGHGLAGYGREKHVGLVEECGRERHVDLAWACAGLA